jgi:hypothetical protein
MFEHSFAGAAAGWRRRACPHGNADRVVLSRTRVADVAERRGPAELRGRSRRHSRSTPRGAGWDSACRAAWPSSDSMFAGPSSTGRRCRTCRLMQDGFTAGSCPQCHRLQCRRGWR